MDKENKTQIIIETLEQYDSATLTKIIREAEKIIETRDKIRYAELINNFIRAGKQLTQEYPDATIIVTHKNENVCSTINLLEYIAELKEIRGEK